MQPDESQRRRHVLDAAERLLRQHGPAKTTMADIAREACVSVGALYLEFDSKDAILEALSALRHGELLAAMKRAARAEALPWESRFRAALDAQVEGFFRLGAEGVHATELVHCSRSPVQLAHARFRSDVHEVLAELLREGHRAGVFDAADPAATATLILKAYAAFWPPWVFEQPRDEVLPRLHAMHDLVLRGLLRR